MKAIRFALLAVLLAFAPSSFARDSFGFSINLGLPGYYAPPPVYYYSPPPVVYHHAPSVYYRYYSPPPKAYYTPRAHFNYGGHYNNHGNRHGHHNPGHGHHGKHSGKWH